MHTDITYLVGSEETLKDIQKIPALPTFDDRIVGFLNELSRALLSKTEYRSYVDLMSYGFWIRKSHLMKEKPRYEGYMRMGKGVTFHIAPSNVPVNFAVSMTSALLAGNACIIRVSDKDFDQVRIITTEIGEILHKDEYKELQKYICIIRYPHSKEITDRLSKICDIRIIWGGDRTIEEVRQSPLPPRGCEMTFADRHSLAIINVGEYARKSEEEKRQIAKDFYTDTYYSDQNACSSPRMVVWYNDSDEICITEKYPQRDEVNDSEEIPVIPTTTELVARNTFWRLLKDQIDEKYELQPVVAVDKLEKFAELATDEELIREMDRGIGEEGNRSALLIRLVDRDPLCMRVELDYPTESLMDYKMLGGYFFEYMTNDMSSIVPVLGKQAQTVAYLGVDPEDIASVIKEFGVRGVDRIVPIGDTMDLSFFWDGYDMIEEMSRRVDIHKV